MNATTLAKDCQLLDQVVMKASDIKTIYPIEQPNKKNKWKKTLRKACVERGITIQFMTEMSSRSKENQTRYVGSQKQILWTLKWRFHSSDKKIEYERLINNISENTLISDILKGIIETSQNDYVASLDITNCAVLLVAEGAVGGGHYLLETDFTLQESFFAKTIIEYPLLDIVPNQFLDEWKIVTIMDVHQIEKPKVEAPKPQSELPSYDTIKEALKLDMIQNALKKTVKEEEKKVILPSTYSK
ncbi:box C/D snoRNA protein 1 [Histomonas meleagridis]|uniref:box C/D snoRNA protein 1 n=1 Tax=Histomonas meleagridis TaxID=135588 RepID=UPI00355952B5|nr:box C/D snoRNA protein 1 [Histomonas meleagridis]KAH0797375.1 box C/D snoRNA protein 1 [Histomonas meleagridis]